MAQAIQTWVAKCKWHGRKEFYCGTFTTNVNDGTEAARREAERLAVSCFEEILPIKVSPPDSIILMPGAIVLHLEREMA